MMFSKYNSGVITIEIRAMSPERFINLLWKNGIQVKNISKIDIITMTLEVNIKDYDKIKDMCKRSNTHLKVISRRGMFFLIHKGKRQASLIGGIIIFAGILYYLSTYMWYVDINTEKYISPYEIRQKIYSYGIKPGIAKRKIDVRLLEDKMMKDNDNIMFIRARIEGSALKISVKERTVPPNIVQENEPCDVVAKCDGEIISIFSTAGTPVVKSGDTVKKGQVLIKGEQGKEGSVYPVHAAGQVTAKTFYENEREMQLKGIKYVQTGKKAENIYAELLGKKIYLKKSLNKFANYDKIVDNKGFVKKEEYSETKPMEFNLNEDQIVEDTVNDLYKKTMESLDNKSAKLLNKIIDKEKSGNNIKIRAVFVVAMNIAIQQKIN